METEVFSKSYYIVFVCGLLLASYAGYKVPGIIAGLMLGSHGYLATMPNFFGIQFQAIAYIVVLFGMIARLSRLSCDGQKWSPWCSFNIRGVVCLIFIFLVGAFGEAVRSQAPLVVSHHIFDGIGLTYMPRAVYVSNRWALYLALIILGILLSNYKVFAMGFVVGFFLEFFISYDHLIGSFNSYKMFNWWHGLDLPGLNRVYVGFESVAALFVVISMFYRAKEFRETGPCAAAFIVLTTMIILSNSKGPVLASVLGILGYGIFFFKKGLKEKTLILALLAFTVLVGSLFFQSYLYNLVPKENIGGQLAAEQFRIIGIEKIHEGARVIGNSFRFNESANIRFEILRMASYPTVDDIFSLLFGRGFGQSRIYYNYTGELVDLGLGTHVFWIDVFLDTGLVGVLVFVYLLSSPLYSYKNEPKTCEVKYLMLFGLLVCWGIKSLLSSDTYSEPLLMLILSLILVRRSFNEKKY